MTDKNHLPDMWHNLLSYSDLEELIRSQTYTEPFIPNEPESKENFWWEQVICINMDKSIDRRKDMTKELKLADITGVKRLRGIYARDGALGCFFSHVACLLQADKNKHLLILEDDFIFNVKKDEAEHMFKRADKVSRGQWDVIVLGQIAQEWQEIDQNVYRLFEASTTSGYLINKKYIEILCRDWITELNIILKYRRSPNLKSEDNLDQIQKRFQKHNLWLGFEKAIGKQRPGWSIIGNVNTENDWSYNDEKTIWYKNINEEFPLLTHPKFKPKNVAMCIIATGPYNNFVNNLLEDIYNKFLCLHNLTVVLFTDNVNEFPDKYKHITIRKNYVKRKGFPGDTLYRYHYFLTEKEFLLSQDYVFYVDVDSKIYTSPRDSELLIENKGIVATETPHKALGEKFGKFWGTPDTNPKSTACIYSDENMAGYYAGGFQGGTAQEYILACETISKNIDIDNENGVMAKWHDESHWNRYLLNNPPKKVLDSGYCFPELVLTELSHWSRGFHEHQIHPVIINLQKDDDFYHKKL